jgi:hydroxymethylbilane synthase
MRIGTRRSPLALAQAQAVAAMLGDCDIVPIVTSGDADARQPAPDTDKSRWVAELEDALLAGEIDVAVHSAKDLPGELADGLALLGAPARAPAEDVLCGVASLDDLPAGARVGTSSVRRVAQLRAARTDLDVVPVRGNVDTRLSKLADPACGLDAIVLAHAGLRRLGQESQIGAVLDAARFVPAPGQGALALEARAGEEPIAAALAAITDADTFACLLAERALARALGASCHTPLGAYAAPAGSGCLTLNAWIGLPDGSQWVHDELAETGIRAEGACHPASVGGFYDPEALGRRVAERLDTAGGGALLRRAQEMAVSLAGEPR